MRVNPFLRFLQPVSDRSKYISVGTISLIECWHVDEHISPLRRVHYELPDAWFKPPGLLLLPLACELVDELRVS